MCLEKDERKRCVFGSGRRIGFRPGAGLRGVLGKALASLTAQCASVRPVAWITSFPGVAYCHLIEAADNHTLRTEATTVRLLKGPV